MIDNWWLYIWINIITYPIKPPRNAWKSIIQVIFDLLFLQIINKQRIYLIIITY